MDMFYLVLAISNREVALTTIPEKYSKEQCETVGKCWKQNTNGNGRIFYCVPAPKFIIDKNINVSIGKECNSFISCKE